MQWSNLDLKHFQTERPEERYPGGELGTKEPTDVGRGATSTARVSMGRACFQKL